MITLEVVTMSGLKFAEDIHEVMIPTPDGEIAVFDNHSPLVSLVDSGIIRIRRTAAIKDADLELMATNGGVLEITKNRVRLLVDEAESSSEVSEEEAAQALKRAQELVASADDNVSLDQAMSDIRTARARLAIVGAKRRKNR